MDLGGGDRCRINILQGHNRLKGAQNNILRLKWFKSCQLTAFLFLPSREKMIFRFFVMRLGVYDVHVAIQVRRVFIVHLALTFGYMEFLWRVAGVENTKFPPVRRRNQHIMPRLRKQRNPGLQAANVNDDLTALTQMLNRLVKVASACIIQIEFFRNRGSKDGHIRSIEEICLAIVRKLYTFLQRGRFIGKSVYRHTSRAQTTSRRCNRGKSPPFFNVLF